MSLSKVISPLLCQHCSEEEVRGEEVLCQRCQFEEETDKIVANVQQKKTEDKKLTIKLLGDVIAHTGFVFKEIGREEVLKKLAICSKNGSVSIGTADIENQTITYFVDVSDEENKLKQDIQQLKEQINELKEKIGLANNFITENKGFWKRYKNKSKIRSLKNDISNWNHAIIGLENGLSILYEERVPALERVKETLDSVTFALQYYGFTLKS